MNKVGLSPGSGGGFRGNEGFGQAIGGRPLDGGSGQLYDGGGYRGIGMMGGT